MVFTQQECNLATVAKLFDMRADYVSAQPYGSGHINDTFLAHYDQAGKRVKFIHQRVNQHVFKEPELVMENIARVTRHATQVLHEQGSKEIFRRTLACVPAITGLPYARDEEGGFWRTYLFIERARSYDKIQLTDLCTSAAKAFADFQKMAVSIEGDLHETIPQFHDTPNRFNLLKAAIEQDSCNRAVKVKEQIEWFLDLENEMSVVVDGIASGEIPQRVTHNDTKLNNVLLDDVTGEGVCVIDLDTTMLGSVLYDFGDMVRSASPSKKEYEGDPRLITMRFKMFEALLKGYLASAREFLTPREIELLPFSARLLTVECGCRYLTDYLNGDVYFKTAHEEHNYDRTLGQIALADSMQQQMEAMDQLLSELIS